MAHSPDSEPAPTPRTGAAARDGAGTLAAGRTRLRDQIAANPLLSLFGAVLAGILGFMGTVVIALLAYTLATTNDRFAEVNDRFARLEAKIDAQDAKIDEINLKLTALIAALNMAPEVGAALQGTLLDPAAAGTAATDPPVGAASGPRQP